MAREIKFRAWHKKNLVYYKVTTIDFLNESVTLVNAHGAVLFGVPLEWVILEQFTGLCDKNNKEINEGDIVVNAIGDLYPVVWSKFYCRFVLKTSLVDLRLASYATPHIEVVGNIHENKEQA